MVERANLRVVVLAVAIVSALLLLVGCTDNATKLSLAIERVARPLEDRPGSSIVTVPYRPKSQPDKPYTLIFFPDHVTDTDDLVEAGIPEKLATRIFVDLAYVGVGDQAMLVVVQEGARLNFTSHFSRFASVDDLLVLHGRGTRNLVLEKRDGRILITGFE